MKFLTLLACVAFGTAAASKSKARPHDFFSHLKHGSESEYGSDSSLVSSGVSTHARRVGTRPATCEELAGTITFLEGLIDAETSSRTLRSYERQLLMAQEEHQEVCTTRVKCPIFHWDNFEYDAIVFGNFESPSSDVEGSLFVAGNFTATGYSIGEFHDEPWPALTVGGFLNWKSGRLWHGDLQYEGEADIGSAVYNGLTIGQNVLQSEEPIDWVEAEKFFLYVRDYIESFKGEFSTGGYMRGSYHQTTCQTLATIHSLKIEHDDYVIINVLGTDCELSNIGIESTAGCSKTLFNFVDAERIHISQVTIPGSVNAPSAHIVGSSGMINGQLVAKSFEGTTQINKCRFTACPIK